MFKNIPTFFRWIISAALALGLYAGVAQAATTSRSSSFEALRASVSEVEQLRMKWAAALSARAQLVERMGAVEKAAWMTDASFSQAWSADQGAFVQVQQALSQTWQSALRKSSATANSLLREPLLLAVETTEFEMRMALGTKMKTELPALKAYSRHDLLADNLISRYARAVVVSTSPEEGGQVLGEIARELALLSQAQIISFDSSLVRSQDAVLVQLRQAGDTIVSERYVWLMAPVNLLVMDIVKHRGPLCETQQWFTKHHSKLLKLVKRYGWPSRKLYLYNRVVGELDGFLVSKNAVTGSNSAGRRYVELPVLLDSLVDPRALALGDCALNGMVTQSPQVLTGRATPALLPRFIFAGNRRYVCPTFACRAPAGQNSTPSQRPPMPTTAKGAHGATVLEAILKSRWKVDKTDLNQMRTMCARDTGGQQGGQPPAAANCDFLDVFNVQSDPYAHYLTCSLQAADSTAGSMMLGVQDLGGVPMDPNCRFAGDDAAGTPPQTEEEKRAAEAAQKKKEEEARAKEQREAADKLRKEQAELQKQLDEVWAKNCLLNPPCNRRPSSTPPASGTSTPPPAPAPTDPPAPPPEPEQNNEPGDDSYLTKSKDEAPPGTPKENGWYKVPAGYNSFNFVHVEKCLALAENEARSCLDALINTAEEQIGIATRNGDDVMKRRWTNNLEFARVALAKFQRRNPAGSSPGSEGAGAQGPSKPNSCDTDPARCDSSCGGITAQLQAGNTCTSNYLDALLGASGRPTRGMSSTQPWNDPRKAHPRPWSDIDSPASTDICSGPTAASSGAAPTGNPACGFVACANPSTPTMGTVGCCGASAAASARALRDHRCDSMYCVDETCNCLQSMSATTMLELPAASVSERQPVRSERIRRR